MTLPIEGYQLRVISSRAYEHPADRAATAALQSIPGLDGVIRKLIDLGYERALRQAYLGASVRLGPEQLPDTWNLHNQVFRTLDLDEVPDLYLTALEILLRLGTASRLPVIAGLPLMAVRAALLEWARAAELSCDRAS